MKDNRFFKLKRVGRFDHFMSDSVGEAICCYCFLLFLGFLIGFSGKSLNHVITLGTSLLWPGIMHYIWYIPKLFQLLLSVSKAALSQSSIIVPLHAILEHAGKPLLYDVNDGLQEIRMIAKETEFIFNVSFSLHI